MKKALVILLALSMVFAVFADEPAAKNEVAEFTGNASVTWGVNLDTGKTGFKNDTSASLKFTLMGAGDKSTSGEGVWGELKIKVGDPLQYENGTWKNGTASVDTAKIHINDMIAIGILSGSNAYGEYKPTLAVFSDKGHVKTDKVGGAVTQGINVDVTLDKLLDLSVDFRSAPTAAYAEAGYKDAFGVDPTKAAERSVKPENFETFEAYWTALQAENATVKSKSDTIAAENARLQAYNDWKKAKDGYKDYGNYANQYGIGAKLALKAVDNLNLSVGFGMDFYGTTKPWGLAVAADYKLGLTETMYIKPQVGFTMSNKEKSGKIATALLVGWGSENQDTNIKWISKKVSDGFSVATEISLDSKKPIPLCVGVWDSTFVENLKVGAQFHVANLKAFAINTLAVEFAYDLGGIKPAVAFAMDNGGDLTETFNKEDTMKLFVGCDFTGFVANTTFSLAYESGNLKASANKLGTVNVTAKIHF